MPPDIVWFLLLLLFFFGAFWHQKRQWNKWLARLTSVLDAIAAGEKPAGFLLGVEPDILRISLLLEKIHCEHERLTLQLERDASNLRAILTSMVEGVLVVDTNRRIQLHNPALRALWGLKEILPDRSVIETFQNAELEWLVRDVFDQKKPITRDLEIDVKKDSKYEKLWVQLSGVPMGSWTNDSNFKGVVLVFHDITRLKQLESVRTEFVANVSHELKTPLSIFRGYVETLLNTPGLPQSDLTRILQTMQRHSMRLNVLVDDLLLLARLESRTMQLRYEEVDLSEFLELIRKDWQFRLEEKKLSLEIDIHEGTPKIQVDSLRFEQIFSNLIDNAIKYTTAGTVIKIRCVLKAFSNEVEMRVEDQGPGIPPDDVPHIFERFYRADKGRSRDQGGTGLGLSIVKHMVQIHKGSVHAESQYGQGTSVIVRIPVNPPKPLGSHI